MQFFEIVLISYCLFGTIFLLFNKQAHRIWALIGPLLFLLQWMLEGLRWQIAPALALLVVLSWVRAFPIGRRWVRYVVFSLGLLFLAVSAWLCYALPVFSLPSPTGPYQVGAYEFAISDTSREEDITTDPNDFREFMVRVWYPASSSTKKPVEYLDETTRKGFAIKYGMPEFVFQYLDHVETHSFWEAPQAAGSFPVVVFAPGLYTPAYGYHALLEELASHGYMVININPTYETMASRFPDGREVFFDREYSAAGWSEEMGKTVYAFENATSDSVRYAAVLRITQIYQSSKNVIRWAADMQTVLGRLDIWNSDPSSFLFHRLNTDQVALLGHSQGGAAALEASLSAPEVRAAINLDGSQWGNLISEGVQVPSLLLNSEWPDEHTDANRYIFSKPTSASFYSLTLTAAGHSTFSDIPLMVRIPQINQAGTISPKTGHRVMNDLILGFLKKYVSDEGDYSFDELVRNTADLVPKENWKLPNP
ncbi:MAG: hypothetical protein AAFQ98_05850 [Bacteroidota bacterium]